MSERSSVAGASLALGVLLAIGLYVWAFDARVHDLGWDSAGSVVQLRAASAGILDLPATRPGTATLGAFVAGIGVAPVGATPIVVSIAAAVTLGLAAATALRQTWDLPTWGIGAAVLLVAAWGGTARLAAGYLANLVSLAVFAGGVAIAVGPSPSWGLLIAAFTAALVAHPGLLPVYAVVLAAWTIVELVRDRADRTAVRTLTAFGVAALLAFAIVVGLLGVGVEDLQDLALVRERFDERSAEMLVWIAPFVSGAMIAAGLTVAIRWREGLRSWPAARLAIVWLAVCVAGLAAVALTPSIPGHRLLPLAVPAPVLGALAVVGTAGSAERRGSLRAVAIVAAGVVTIALSLAMLRPFDVRADRRDDGLGSTPAAIAGFVDAAGSTAPTIVVMDPSDRLELLAWKARLNAIRALVATGDPLRIVLYLGDERVLASGRPTRRPGDPLFDAVVERTWPSVHEALGRSPTIVVPHAWVPPDTWQRVASSVDVRDELGIVRGTVPAAIRPATRPTLSHLGATGRIAALLVILAAIGGGWAATASGDAAAAAGLAPAAGIVAVIFVGVAVAVVGADPRGPAAWAGVSIVGLAGWIVRDRSRAAW